MGGPAQHPAPRAPEPRETATGERVLVLELARGRYAIPERALGGVARSGALHPVPLAPPAVLGLAEWRGRLLTVLDLPALVHDAPLGNASCLVRLAAPLDHTALLVPGAVRLVAVDAAGEDLTTLDPLRIVEALGREISALVPGPVPRGERFPRGR